MRAAMASRASFATPAIIAVSMTPGQSALTVMPKPATSAASERVSARSPPFDAA